MPENPPSRSAIRNEIRSRLLERVKSLPVGQKENYPRRILRASRPESLRALYAEIVEVEKAAIRAAEIDAEARLKNEDADFVAKYTEIYRELEQEANQKEEQLVSTVNEIVAKPTEKKEIDHAAIARSVNADPEKQKLFRSYLFEKHGFALAPGESSISEEDIERYYDGFPQYYRERRKKDLDVKTVEGDIRTLEELAEESLGPKSFYKALEESGKVINKNEELRKKFGAAYAKQAKILMKDPKDKEAMRQLQVILSDAADTLTFQKEQAGVKPASSESAPQAPSVEAETPAAAPVRTAEELAAAAELSAANKVKDHYIARKWLNAELSAMLEHTGQRPDKLLRKVETIIAGPGSEEERTQKIVRLGLSGAPLWTAIDLMHSADRINPARIAAGTVSVGGTHTLFTGMPREEHAAPGPDVVEEAGEQHEEQSEDEEEDREERSRRSPAERRALPVTPEEESIPTEEIEPEVEDVAAEEEPVAPIEGLPVGWENFAEVVALTEARKDYARLHGKMRNLLDKDSLARKLEILSDTTSDGDREETIRNLLNKHKIVPEKAGIVFEAMAARFAYLKAKTALSKKLREERLANIPAGALEAQIEAIKGKCSSEIFELLILKENRELMNDKIEAFTPEKKRSFMGFVKAAVQKTAEAMGSISAVFKNNPRVAQAARFIYVGAATAIRAYAFGIPEAIFAVGGRVMLTGAVLKARNWYHKRYEKEMESDKELAISKLRSSLASDHSLKNIARVSSELERIDRKVALINKTNAGVEILAMGLAGFISGQGVREAQKALFHSGLFENFAEVMTKKYTFFPKTETSFAFSEHTDPHTAITKDLKNMGLDRPKHMDVPAEHVPDKNPARVTAPPEAISPVQKGHLVGTNPFEAGADNSHDYRGPDASRVAETASDSHDYTGPDARGISSGIDAHDYAGGSLAQVDPHDYTGPSADTAPRPRVADIARAHEAQPAPSTDKRWFTPVPERKVGPGMIDIYAIHAPQVLKEMQMFESQTHELAALDGISLKEFIETTPPLEPMYQGSSFGRQIANGLVRRIYKLPDGLTKEVTLTPRQAILRAYLDPWRNELAQRGLEKASLRDFLDSLMKQQG